MAINENDYKYVSDLFLAKLGNRLEGGKEYLVEARFATFASRAGLKGVDELVQAIRRDPNGPTAVGAMEALTTNETFFFRDEAPFAVLREKVLPDLAVKRGGRKTLNIWSAACSSGQEAYSIAICVRETLAAHPDWNVNILGTDISSSSLAKAREAGYNDTEVNRGLSRTLREKYFSRQEEMWQVRDDLRRMVRFKPMNLCLDWPALPRMDVIFLRNVLIYMPEEKKRSILARAKDLLEPDGYLFLGAAETTYKLEDRFEKTGWERSGCYRPV